MRGMGRRDFLEGCVCAVVAAGVGSTASGSETATDGAGACTLQCPEAWLNDVYRHAAQDNVLKALNPDVFFGYFCVCADGQGFGFANSYPSLDGHQLSHALLYLGRSAEVLANWAYVKQRQKPDGHLPIMVNANGEGLYTHWCPGDPLRALGPVTYAHNAHAIYAHTLDDAWLRANLPSLNLAMGYLESLTTPGGRVGGAGFYVEMPTRIEWDGVSQCYAVDALERAAALNARAGDEPNRARWAALAQRIRANFAREFWRGDHCVEYLHPARGAIDTHGLTDVDWAALAIGMLPEAEAQRLWQRAKDERGFRYGGMPTGISTHPESYEDWEFIPADQFPNHDRRHDLAAMGRVWYLESWARARWGDIAGLLDAMRAVADIGAANGYSWQERYFPSGAGPRPGGPMTYCEYPANLVRIVNLFLLGVEPDAAGALRIAPQVPREWWAAGWQARLAIGEGRIALNGERGRLSGTWRGGNRRRLVFVPPPGGAWTGGSAEPAGPFQADGATRWCDAPPDPETAFCLDLAWTEA